MDQFWVAMTRSSTYITKPEEAANLAKQNEIMNEEDAGLKTEGLEVSDLKKPFVEPTISVPVDVLEATTFFQAATSSVTN